MDARRSPGQNSRSPTPLIFMRDAAILLPIFALALWTAVVLFLLPITRVRAGFRREIVVDDFKYGESDHVPPRVSLPNRNFMNLLELPMLFYVVCIALYVTLGVVDFVLMRRYARPGRPASREELPVPAVTY